MLQGVVGVDKRDHPTNGCIRMKSVRKRLAKHRLRGCGEPGEAARGHHRQRWVWYVNGTYLGVWLTGGARITTDFFP